ncbi:MAG: protein kinase [Phycisphaerales bacterium]|nr:protein kinase [Phycisphaerales bacterium]
MSNEHPPHDSEETSDQPPGDLPAETEAFDHDSIPPGANVPGNRNGPHGEPIPESIDRYHIDRLLGHGGFGVVYQATQSEPVKRTVALKVIRRGMNSESILVRFHAERQALAVMNHPGVAKMFDAGRTEEGQPWFAMELVPGLPMNEFCDRNQLDLNERIRLMIKVCEAIQHAHVKSVIHRDLKPGNILVTVDGSEITPRVIDFGIAKAVEQDLDSRGAEVTIDGQMLGTPEYMAPEQTGFSDVDVDGRADVYALGAIFYLLLCGDLPIHSKQLRDAISKGGLAAVQTMVRELEPPRPSVRYRHSVTEEPARSKKLALARRTTPSRLQRQLENDLDWIALKCLEKDRERRYDSPTALAEDLRRYLRHEPVFAGPPSAGYVARKFVRRNRPLVIGTSAVLLVLVSGLFTSLVLLARALEAEEDARATISALIELPTADDPNQAGSSATIGELNQRLIAKIRNGEIARRPRDQAMLLARISLSSYNHGDYEKSLRQADMVLALQQDESIDPKDIEQARKIRGLSRLALGKTLAVARESSNTEAVTPGEHLRSGFVSFDLGDYDKAAWHLQKTIEATSSDLTENWDDYVSASEWLARLLADQGQDDAAQRLLDLSSAAHEQFSDPDATEEAQWDAATELARGALARARGDFMATRNHLLEANRIYTELHGDQPNRMVDLSAFELERARIDEAVHADEPDADLLARSPEQGRMEFILLRNRARSFLRLDDIESCLQLLALAILVEEEIAPPERQPGHTRRVRARILADHGDLTGASDDMERAIEEHSASLIGKQPRAELLLELSAIRALMRDEKKARSLASEALEQRKGELPETAWPIEIARAHVALFTPGEEDHLERILQSLDEEGDPAAAAVERIRSLAARIKPKRTEDDDP